MCLDGAHQSDAECVRMGDPLAAPIAVSWSAGVWRARGRSLCCEAVARERERDDNDESAPFSLRRRTANIDSRFFFVHPRTSRLLALRGFFFSLFQRPAQTHPPPIRNRTLYFLFPSVSFVLTFLPESSEFQASYTTSCYAHAKAKRRRASPPCVQHAGMRAKKMRCINS